MKLKFQYEINVITRYRKTSQAAMRLGRHNLVMVQGLTSQKKPIFPPLLIPGAKVKPIESNQKITYFIFNSKINL